LVILDFGFGDLSDFVRRPSKAVRKRSAFR
jgi:hypothetical protein